MTEGITMDDKIPFLKDTISPEKRSLLFPEEEPESIRRRNTKIKRETKNISVHHLLGGGKFADALLWKNKKISATTLCGATIVWILFKWLDYNFLTMLCCTIILVMSAQFVCSNASGVVNSSQPEVHCIVLPDHIAIWISAQVVVGLIATAIIGSLCNFLTILYSGFVAAHILPVLYERYEDQINGCWNNVCGYFQHHYKKLRNFRGKKKE